MKQEEVEIYVADKCLYVQCVWWTTDDIISFQPSVYVGVVIRLTCLSEISFESLEISFASEETSLLLLFGSLENND